MVVIVLWIKVTITLYILISAGAHKGTCLTYYITVQVKINRAKANTAAVYQSCLRPFVHMT